MAGSSAYYILLVLIYFLLKKCYITLKYNKKDLTLFDMILNTVLHCELTLTFGSYMLILGSICYSMLPEVKGLECSTKFISAASEWGS